MKPIVTVICETVGRHYHVSVDDIESSVKTKTVCLARAVAMYVVRTKLGFSWNELGTEFHRDHTTGMSACKRVRRIMADERCAAAIRAAEKVAEEWRTDA